MQHLWPSNSAPGSMPSKSEGLCPPKDTYRNASSSFIYHSRKLNCPNVCEQKDEYTRVLSYNRLPHGNEREPNYCFTQPCGGMLPHKAEWKRNTKLTILPDPFMQVKRICSIEVRLVATVGWVIRGSGNVPYLGLGGGYMDVCKSSLYCMLGICEFHYF